MSDKPTIRVFISSPDDVRPERLIAQRIVARLDREFAYHLRVEAVLWERAPLVATYHFQDPRNIPAPRSADIVVVILWSRLGVLLPEGQFRGALSGRAVTGTEWEFEDALAGARERGMPHLLLYRKDADPVIGLRNRAAAQERIAQLERVEEFVTHWLRATDSESFTGAFATFTNTAVFEQQLFDHLHQLLVRRAGAYAGAVTIRWHEPPFRGLLSFEFEHAPVFFGRTRARNELREILARQQASGHAFVLVLGASGSGKSSLVKAGLLPDLKLRGMIGPVALCRHAVMRPSGVADDLVGGLAKAILSASGLPELAELHCPAERLAGLLREAPNQAALPIEQGLAAAGVSEALTEIADARLVLIVDQLEELFTIERVDPEDRRHFVAALDALSRSGFVWIIATMRSDFFHWLEALPELVKLAPIESRFLLLPPDDAELGQIIRQPAHESGLRFEIDPQSEIGLDEAIRQEAARNPAALPLLSFLLDQLWVRRDAQSGMLTFSAYRALGGFEGALATRAEEIFQALPQEVQASFSQLIRALVTITSDAAAQPTARVVPLSSFPENTDVGRLARAFLAPDARLVVADSDGDVGVIRIAHEAIISSWPRAEDEVAANWQDLQRRARVEAAASLWLAEGRPEARLLAPGLPLSEAIDLLEHGKDTIDQEVIAFIEASVSLHKARLQNRLARREEISRVSALHEFRNLQRNRFYLRTPGQRAALILLMITLIMCGLDPVPLHEMRARTFDMAQRLWPRGEAADPVLIVAIDEESLAAKGQWPWPRTLVADLVRRIAAGRPDVLGIDILFAEPDRFSPQLIAESLPGLPPEAAAALARLPANDALLGAAIATVPTVLVTNPFQQVIPRPAGPQLFTTPVRDQGSDPRPFLFKYPTLIQNRPEITRGAVAEGVGAVVPDRGGIVRRLPLAVLAEGRLVPGFAAEVVAVARKQPSVVVTTGAHGVERVAAADVVAPTDARGQAILNFAPSEMRYFSATDVLDPAFDSTQFAGHVVLLGVTGLGIVDQKQTPLGLMENVHLHAQLIDAMRAGSLLRLPTGGVWTELTLALLAGIVPIFLLRYETPALAAGIALGMVLLLLAGEFAFFRLAHVIIDGVCPALSAILTFGVMLGGNLYAAERAKRRAETSITRVVNAFEEYMSDT
jgi:CHASE2 domain-containing sensor protein